MKTQIDKPCVKVFLDDIRSPSQVYSDGEEWILVSTVEDVIRLLKQGNVDYLSLDNDLGLNCKEGHTVVTWMIETGIWPSTAVLVHSSNVARSKQMREDIARHFVPKQG